VRHSSRSPDGLEELQEITERSSDLSQSDHFNKKKSLVDQRRKSSVSMRVVKRDNENTSRNMKLETHSTDLHKGTDVHRLSMQHKTMGNLSDELQMKINAN
jgi:hypothetical protein